jgi:hypothetical protein
MGEHSNKMARGCNMGSGKQTEMTRKKCRKRKSYSGAKRKGCEGNKFVAEGRD